MKLRISYCIEKGKHKKECEDSAIIGKNIINDSTGEITIEIPAWIGLCDGVGGNAGGKKASLFVAEYLAGHPVPDEENAIQELLIDCNSKLLEEAANSHEYKTMATTATILAFGDANIHLIHVGNTRLHAVKGSYLQQLTKDQTTYQWFLDSGNQEMAELCNHSEIRGAMGGGNENCIRPMVVERIFKKRIPGCMLFTTDGIHDAIGYDDLEEIASGDGAAVDKTKKMCLKALENGTEDDRSAVIVEIAD